MDKEFNEQEVYERLYLKMVDYKRDYPFIDFLNDIVARRDKSFNKEGAYNDLEKVFDAFMKYRNEAQKYEQLEKQIGCPPEVRCKLYNGMTIYGKRKKWQIDIIDKEVLICYKPHCRFTGQVEYFKFSDYKITWWLKANHEE